MRGHAQPRDLLHLQLDVRVDHVVAEHAAAREELAVLVEVAERLVERCAHGRDLRFLFRRQVVQVLVRRLARMDLVLHAIEPGHHQRREQQVGVRHRIREPDLDAPTLRVADERNPDRRRTVARRIGKLHRRLETRHQPLVRVGARVGDRIQRPCVLDDSADVEQREVRQPGVLVAGEQVLAVLPDRLVHVHARTVVADDRLGHEGGRLAIAVRDVVDHVLHRLQPVGTLHQRRELRADFVLPGPRHLVVMHFHRNAHLLEDQAHLGAHVLERIDRRHREITALHWRAVREVAALDLLARRPRGLFGVDLHEATRHVEVPGHRVEDEELGLRAEIGGVADAGGLQVGLGAARERARVARVALAVGRFDHVAGDDQRGLLAKRVHVRGGRVGHQQHVRGLDALPAGDRRTVEGVARRDLVLVEHLRRHRDVLLLAAGVGEAKIDELHFVVGNQLHHVFDGGHAGVLLVTKVWIHGAAAPRCGHGGRRAEAADARFCAFSGSRSN